MEIILLYLYLGLWSRHSDYCRNCNENHNPLVGIEFSYNQKRYFLLNYNNSQNRNTTIGAKKNLWSINKYLEYGLFYGVATGYNDGLIPMTAPILIFDYDIISIETSCIYDFDRKYLCALSLRWAF